MAIKKICPTCNGEGVLDNCDGTHTEKCVTCDGDGFVDISDSVED